MMAMDSPPFLKGSRGDFLRGFSLIEVMIAAVLLGLMGTVLFSSLTSSIDITERAESISNRHHMIRQAMSRLTKELSMAYVSNNKNVQNLVMNTQFRGEKDEIAFVAFGGYQHRQNAKESGEREISYFVKDNNLMRREKENPGRELFKEGKARIVCPKIDKINFKYFNKESSAWDSEWKTEGKPAREITLPSRVRIELQARLKEDDNEVETIVTETELWLTQPIFLVP